MAGFDHQPERAWDEYDWERFLQQQDHKTEKYMELLEKYLDDPNRDQIIAREMGWTQLLDGRDWTQEVDALLEEEEEEKPPPPDSFEDHSLYRAAFALTVWIDHMFDQDATLQNEPSAVKLATHAALASAKLAAALSGEDVDEIGMTIAYLKRALKADRSLPACGPFAATFPGARRDHYANRGISLRVAPALRLRRLSGLNEL